MMKMRTRLWLCSTMVLASLAVSPPVNAQPVVGTLEGYARVKDGDGVLFGKVEIRLQGIAAPEDNSREREPGGQEATAFLANLIEGTLLVCKLDGTLARGRPVAACFVGEQDIGAALVAAGHARDCPAFSMGRYAQLEDSAKAIRDLSSIYPLPDYCLTQ